MSNIVLGGVQVELDSDLGRDYAHGMALATVPAGCRGWGDGKGGRATQQAPAALMRTTRRNEKVETCQTFKTTGQLLRCNGDARVRVRHVQYRVLRNGFEALTSMRVREGNSGALGYALIKTQLATAIRSMSGQNFCIIPA
jgi:hypothetical protein